MSWYSLKSIIKIVEGNRPRRPRMTPGTICVGRAPLCSAYIIVLPSGANWTSPMWLAPVITARDAPPEAGIICDGSSAAVLYGVKQAGRIGRPGDLFDVAILALI